MVKSLIENEKNILFLTLVILAHCLIFVSNTSWNFDKGGADWPSACKDGNQAPIDISQPFTFKSNLIKNKRIFIFLRKIFKLKKIKINFFFIKNYNRIRHYIFLSKYDDRISFLQ